jgi:hypothetical protein
MTPYKVIFIFLLIPLVSCVSTKKYKMMTQKFQTSYEQNVTQSATISDLLNSLDSLKKANEILQNTVRHQEEINVLLKSDLKFKSDRIDGLNIELKRIQDEKDVITKSNEALIQSNTTYVGITKNLLSDLEVQHLKVLNLSIALERQDSLNIHLVKKVKREMSDKKYKRALEKLGFVFE